MIQIKTRLPAPHSYPTSAIIMASLIHPEFLSDTTTTTAAAIIMFPTKEEQAGTLGNIDDGKERVEKST